MAVINGLYGGAGGNGSSLDYDNTNSGLASTNMQGAIDEIASLNRMIVVSTTLVETSWEGASAPYKYRISSDKIKSDDSNIFIAPGADVTMEQDAMIRNAIIEPISQGDGYIDIVARGNKPTMNIPVNIYIGKLISVPDGRDARYIRYTNKPEGSWVQSDNIGGTLAEFEEKFKTFSPESKASSILIDDSKMDLGASNVQEALEAIVNGGISGSRRHLTTTIKAANWLGDTAPYVNTTLIDGITKNTDVEIGTVFDMTLEQYQELSKAAIVAGCTLDGRLVLKAFGEKPSIDLTVDVIIYG